VASLLGAAGLSLGVAACAGNKKPAAAPASAPSSMTTTADAAKPATNDKPAAITERLPVNVDDEIVAACKLKFESIEQAPKFDYDSEALSEAEKNVLEAVAKCLATGPLKGRSVELVGRADARGEPEYNMSLGAKRARTVHSFLTNLGVPSDKLRETSRGELDALGTDDAGWRKDRRVDVRLIK